jgi:glycosyltransferase involved in cell wall biosynthesis
MSLLAQELSPRTAAGAKLLVQPVPVLFTVRQLHLGGIERDVTKIAIALKGSRFEAHVASYQAEGIRYEELRRAGIPFLHLPVTSFRSPTAFSAAIRLRRYIREHEIRLVHAWDPTAVFAVPLARALRVPVVLSSTLGSRGLLDPRTCRQVRWTDHLVDSVVVNCEAMRRQMIFDERFPLERVKLCYNGYDPEEFYPPPAEKAPSTRSAPLVIGTVSVLRSEKALDLLMEAFARVRHLQAGMKLVIVGSGPELPKLETSRERLGLQEDCFLVPATSQVARQLHNFDVFVSSSTSEAFSNAILEAMACGVCVTASNVGGTPELIGNDERGLLFEPGNAADLATKLARLIQSEDLRRKLGRRAAEFARTHFTLDVAAKRMAEIYESMLRRKAAWPE